MMSIFDNTFVEPGWNCVWATKNISNDGEYKHVIVNLIYELDNQQAEVQASYAVNAGGKISIEQPTKMVIKKYNTSESADPEVTFRRSLRAYRPDEVTPEMIKDLNTVNEMFDLADNEVRRVYL